jgi:hypothetical protein
MSVNFDSPIERDFCGAQVERPKLPALDARCFVEKKNLPEGAPYGVFLECDLSCRERQLLAAQSRIRELEQNSSFLQSELCEQHSACEKAEAERDRLKADYKSVVDSYARLVVKHGRIAVVTETPEWFDSPCARAVREVIESK